MGAATTTTFGSYTLPNPTKRIRWEYEPTETEKVMLGGNLQKRGLGFRRVYRYVARCSEAKRAQIEAAYRAHWMTPANFSPYGETAEYSCVVRGRPSFQPLTHDNGYFEVSMTIVEVTGHTS